MMYSRIVISKNETQLKLRAGYACAIHDIDNNDNISTRYVFFKFTFYITQTAKLIMLSGFHGFECRLREAGDPRDAPPPLEKLGVPVERKCTF